MSCLIHADDDEACESPLYDRIKGSLIRDTIALIDPPAYDRKALANVNANVANLPLSP
jgi:hypothetical protein